MGLPYHHTMATNILLLAPLGNSGGNFTTAERIRQQIANEGHYIVLMDPKDFKDTESLTGFIDKTSTALVIGLHAVQSGSLLHDCRVPYIIVFGGTDLNVYSHDQELMTSMTKAIKNAVYMVGFSKAMVDRARQLWPDLADDSLIEIPQAVETCPSQFNLQAKVKDHIGRLNVEGHRSIPKSATLDLFTLVAGIRKVKDPLFLVKDFSDWHQDGHMNAFLVIIGPVLEEEFGRKFEEHLRCRPGVVYIGGLSQPDTHAAIATSFALVNSSLSEGNSMAILEAMSLGVPVIARDIPGNIALVTDSYTGLTFTTPHEFTRKAEMLLSDDRLRHKLIGNGQHLVSERHSNASEQNAYSQLISNALK